MLPRVNNPDGIQTADYLFRGEEWDLKIPRGTGKRMIEDLIKKKRNQAHNFVFDISRTKLSKQLLFNQIYKIYNSETTMWVDKIIIKENDNLIIIYERKKRE